MPLSPIADSDPGQVHGLTSRGVTLLSGCTQNAAPVAILEGQDGGLEDLDSQVIAVSCGCLVDVSFLPGGHAAMQLTE